MTMWSVQDVVDVDGRHIKGLTGKLHWGRIGASVCWYIHLVMSPQTNSKNAWPCQSQGGTSTYFMSAEGSKHEHAKGSGLLEFCHVLPLHEGLFLVI